MQREMRCLVCGKPVSQPDGNTRRDYTGNKVRVNKVGLAQLAPHGLHTAWAADLPGFGAPPNLTRDGMGVPAQSNGSSDSSVLIVSNIDVRAVAWAQQILDFNSETLEPFWDSLNALLYVVLKNRVFGYVPGITFDVSVLEINLEPIEDYVKECLEKSGTAGGLDGYALTVDQIKSSSRRLARIQTIRARILTDNPGHQSWHFDWAEETDVTMFKTVVMEIICYLLIVVAEAIPNVVETWSDHELPYLLHSPDVLSALDKSRDSINTMFTRLGNALDTPPGSDLEALRTGTSCSWAQNHTSQCDYGALSLHANESLTSRGQKFQSR